MSPAPKIFHISVHSDANIYTTAYKRVIANHALYVQNRVGRAHGKTLRAPYILAKIGEALMDCGAVPLVESSSRPRFSGRPLTFFVTQLDAYWEAAITDLAKVGVRIYVLPVMDSVEGMPDPVEDSFNEHYTNKLQNLVSAAERGADVRDILEVTLSMASHFEAADIHLKDKHKALIDKVLSYYSEPKSQPSEKPTPEEFLPGKPLIEILLEETAAPLLNAPPTTTVDDDF
jgi:hypothetical protein